MLQIIHTGLYSDAAFNIINAAYHAITHHDGRFWRKLEDVKVERLPNNEIVFNCSQGGYRSFKNKMKSELEAKIWFARTMKMVTNEASVIWKRDNTEQNYKLTLDHKIGSHPTIQQTYFIYDVLIERKRLELKYSKELIDEIRGIERDDLATELEVERRNQVKEITKKYEKLIYDANPNSYGKAYDEVSRRVREFKEKLVAEFKVEMNKIIKQRDDEIAAVNATAEAAISGQAAFMCA